jgi:hypothetical protein
MPNVTDKFTLSILPIPVPKAVAVPVAVVDQEKLAEITSN